MMEGERQPCEHMPRFARALQALDDPESRAVLIRFLAEFAEHWPWHVEREGGRRDAIDVDWSSVHTAEEFDMAAKTYADAFNVVREEGFQQGIQQGVQQAALKFLGTALEPSQLASLENAWRQTDWSPDLDAVLAVRDGAQPWTSLFPPTPPVPSDNGRHDG